MTKENSGLTCSYYEIFVEKHHMFEDEKDPYMAECGEIANALHLTPVEANIFKEVWRTATHRLGKVKEGNTKVRGAEKILFFAKYNHKRVSHDEGLKE